MITSTAAILWPCDQPEVIVLDEKPEDNDPKFVDLFKFDTTSRGFTDGFIGPLIMWFAAGCVAVICIAFPPIAVLVAIAIYSFNKK